MTALTVAAQSALAPEQVLVAAYDFTPRRELVWPNVAEKRFEVHARGDTYAEVTEGTWVVGVVWERCRYDWSRPGVVTATVLESNVYEPEVSRFVWAVSAADGGSRVEMTLERVFKGGPKARVLSLIYRFGGRRLFGSMLEDVLEAIERVDPGIRPDLGVRSPHGMHPSAGAGSPGP